MLHVLLFILKILGIILLGVLGGSWRVSSWPSFVPGAVLGGWKLL